MQEICHYSGEINFSCSDLIICLCLQINLVFQSRLYLTKCSGIITNNDSSSSITTNISSIIDTVVLVM